MMVGMISEGALEAHSGTTAENSRAATTSEGALDGSSGTTATGFRAGMKK
jgi:hypothetical protein